MIAPRTRPVYRDKWAIPSILSTNINSLSVTTSGGVSGRFARVISLICFLLSSSLIVCLQDIRIPTDGLITELQPFAPNHHFIVSTHNHKKSGGVVTILHPDILRDYSFNSTHITRGSSLSTTFTHKHIHNKEFTLINNYLDASSNDLWHAQVKNLASFGSKTNTIAVGDFNHTTCNGDRSGYHLDKSPTAAADFKHWLDNNNFQEVDQPHHTWYGMREERLASSKIDKVFHNFDYHTLINCTPSATAITSAPHTVTQYGVKHGYRGSNNPRLIDSYIPCKDGGTHVTDHLPVRVSFANSTTSYNPNSFSSSALSNSEFLNEFTLKFDSEHHTGDCFSQLNDLKNTLRCTSHWVRKLPNPINSKNASLWEAVKLVNAIDDGLKSHDQLMTDFSHIPDFTPLIDNPTALIDKINLDFATAEFESEGSTHKPFSRIATLAKTLPRKKSAINCLYDGESITDDPERMTEIIDQHWGGKWSKSPIQDPTPLFNIYNKTIKTKPTNIDLDFVIDSIMETNDSSPGPDGIPFAAYRIVVDTAAPILLGCIKMLMAGHSPPSDFNSGILHLLPKKDTDRVEDTRPLVVNNTDNRIISSAICRSITPSIDSIISPNQNGFRNGRSVHMNIEYFNERFYQAQDNENFYDIMFIDFCKAFDSISHEAIFKLIDAVGFSDQYSNVIKSLFINAYCNTNVKGCSSKRIDFHSGVKQGCPLSPTLFILVVDVLIDLIENVCPSSNVRFFADDGAIGSDNLVPLLPSLKKCFDLFKNTTGLAMNPDKTACIATGGKSHLRAALDEIGWNQIEISGNVRYLGLYMGHNTTPEDNYRGPYEKMVDRLMLFLPRKGNYSISKRVTIWNTWIVSIFSFVNDFFHMPDDYVEWVDEAAQLWLDHGRTFKTLHYSRPTHLAGLTTPLRDVRMANFARLAALADDVPTDPLTPAWSPRITNHRETALCHVREAYSIKIKPKTPSTTIYRKMICSDPMQIEYKPYITQKLAASGLSADQQSVYLSNYALIPSWIPDYARYTNLAITHNMLHTGDRQGIPDTCYLCNTHLDDIHHIYHECKVAKAASNSFWTKLTGNQNSFTFPDCVLARFYLDQASIAAQIMLTDSIWRARSISYRGTVKDAEGWSKWIVDNALKRICEFQPTFFNSNFTSSTVPISYKINYRLNLGSSKRKAAGDIQPKKVVKNTIKKFTVDTIYAFTDGSASPNPGPAGAGAALYTRGSDKDPVLISAALGHGTNNLGELFAIGLTITHCIDINYNGTLHIFTDSKLVYNAIQCNHRIGNENSALFTEVRKLIRSARHLFNVHMYWVPGHSDISQNDAADKLANAGSSHSANFLNYAIDVVNLVRTSGFNSLTIDVNNSVINRINDDMNYRIVPVG